MKLEIKKSDNYLVAITNKELKVGDWYLFNWQGENDIQRFRESQISDRENNKHLYETACHKIVAHLALNGVEPLDDLDLLPISDSGCCITRDGAITVLNKDCFERNRCHQIVESVDKLALKYSTEIGMMSPVNPDKKSGFIQGWQEAKKRYQYSQEFMMMILRKTARKYFDMGRENNSNMSIEGDPLFGLNSQLVELLESTLGTNYPIYFEAQMKCGRCYMPLTKGNSEDCWSANSCSRGSDFNDVLDTITTKEGKNILVGNYIYR